MDTQTDILDRALIGRDIKTATELIDLGVDPSPETVVLINALYPESQELVGTDEDIELTQDELNNGLKNSIIADNDKSVNFFLELGARVQPSNVDIGMEHADDTVINKLISEAPVTLMNLVSAVLHGRQQAAYRIAKGFYNAQQQEIRNIIDADDNKSLCEHLPNLDIHDMLLIAVYEGSLNCVKELVNNNAKVTIDMITLSRDRGYSEITDILLEHI